MAFLDTLTVEPLPPAEKAGGFDCGEPELTDYLCDGTAQKDQLASMARTYIVRSDGALVGYFSVLADAIRLSTKERPHGRPYGSAPAVKLGRMGVAKEYRGCGVGEWILDFVVGMARSMSAGVGVRYVTLDALSRDKLVAWYGRYGFVRNEGHERGLKILREALARISAGKDLPQVSMRFDILLEREVAK